LAEADIEIVVLRLPDRHDGHYIMKRGGQAMASSVEAVIISGPRRGEIVQLSDEAIAEVSDADITALNEALDGLLVALDHVAAEVRATLEVLGEQARES
jgi:hypothetical protein